MLKYTVSADLLKEPSVPTRLHKYNLFSFHYLVWIFRVLSASSLGANLLIMMVASNLHSMRK